MRIAVDVRRHVSLTGPVARGLPSQRELSLHGATVLLTGASGGIGAAIADRLAGAGARLLVTGRDREALARVAQATGGTALVADLSTPEGAGELAAAALGTADTVDVVVCNAGVGWAGQLTAMDALDIERLVAVNLCAPMHLVRALLPGMLARGYGQIVLVTSVAAAGVAGEAVYSATKGGLAVFADALALELTGRGVGVSVVVPGVVDTGFFDRRGASYARRWPRPMQPERVADAVLHAVRHRRARVHVPRWLGLAARLHGGAPGLYRALARRFG